MVEKICRKIGQFIIYCLKLCEYEKKEEKPIETLTPIELINEWLYGAQGGKKNE